MSGPFMAEWLTFGNEGGRRSLRPEDVTTLLDELDARITDGVLVDITAPTGAVLTVGVGRPNSVVNFQESHDPPYWGSVGNLPGEPDDNFSYMGSYSDFCSHSYVGKETAWAAAQEFVSTGSRPQNVEWEEV